MLLAPMVPSSLPSTARESNTAAYVEVPSQVPTDSICHDSAEILQATWPAQIPPLHGLLSYSTSTSPKRSPGLFSFARAESGASSRAVPIAAGSFTAILSRSLIRNATPLVNVAEQSFDIPLSFVGAENEKLHRPGTASSPRPAHPAIINAASMYFMFMEHTL